MASSGNMHRAAASRNMHWAIITMITVTGAAQLVTIDPDFGSCVS